MRNYTNISEETTGEIDVQRILLTIREIPVGLP